MWSCQAAQTAVTAPEAQGDFSFLLPGMPIIDFAGGSSLRPFPGNIIPVSRLDPVWPGAVAKLPMSNSGLPVSLDGSVQSACTVGENGIISVNASANQAVSSFGGFRMLPYALFPTRTSTFKLYVNGIVVAQQQVQYPVVH